MAGHSRRHDLILRYRIVDSGEETSFSSIEEESDTGTSAACSPALTRLRRGGLLRFRRRESRSLSPVVRWIQQHHPC
eukprot:138627-Hanusia_phi.AAC.1